MYGMDLQVEFVFCKVVLCLVVLLMCFQCFEWF